MITPMRIADFALERYFARWEFAVRHVLCASDVEGWSMAELLDVADEEMAATWAGLRLGYTESTGHPLLRREIASLYQTVDPDGVLTFAGAEEAIFCLMSSAVGPGDHVIVGWPGYQSLYEVARAAGAEVSLHALREEDGWGLDVDRLRRSIRPTTRMMVLNAPHNPTGMLPTPEEWAEVASMCADAGIRLLADEVYRGLEHGDAASLQPGADMDARFISLGVLSKSFALPGLRIGWLATRDRSVLEACARMKDYTTICSSAPSEILGIIGLRRRDALLARSRAIVAANLSVLDDFFARRTDAFSWVRPRGSSIAFPRLVPDGLAGRSAELFCAGLVEATGVLLLPSGAFGFGDGHVRLGYGRTDMAEALQAVERYIDGERLSGS
jgi:aspartate/methionine/tyrosine aminotransferase